MCTSFKLKQSAKAQFSISVTLCGIIIEDKFMQAPNVACLILVKALGKLIYWSVVQNQYLQPIITQYFIDNKSEIWLLFLIAHSKR